MTDTYDDVKLPDGMSWDMAHACYQVYWEWRRSAHGDESAHRSVAYLIVDIYKAIHYGRIKDFEKLMAGDLFGHSVMFAPPQDGRGVMRDNLVPEVRWMYDAIGARLRNMPGLVADDYGIDYLSHQLALAVHGGALCQPHKKREEPLDSITERLNRQRRYSVAEIDRMRMAIERKWTGQLGEVGPVVQTGLIMLTRVAIEDELRTHLVNGTDPADLDRAYPVVR